MQLTSWFVTPDGIAAPPLTPSAPDWRREKTNGKWIMVLIPLLFISCASPYFRGEDDQVKRPLSEWLTLQKPYL
ncbi:MAG: hypothetical protein ACQEQQ_11240 [Chloroflexota bacterium]